MQLSAEASLRKSRIRTPRPKLRVRPLSKSYSQLCILFTVLFASHRERPGHTQPQGPERFKFGTVLLQLPLAPPLWGKDVITPKSAERLQPGSPEIAPAET